MSTTILLDAKNKREMSTTMLLDAKNKSNMKLMLALARKLNLYVRPLTKDEEEDVEDLFLLRKMEVSRNDELADTDEVLRELGIAAK